MDPISKVNSANVGEISEMMKLLKISDEGLETLTQMKERVIEEIKRSQKNASWSPGKVGAIYLFKIGIINL